MSTQVRAGEAGNVFFDDWCSSSGCRAVSPVMCACCVAEVYVFV
jgi:hypothetical protein